MTEPRIRLSTRAELDLFEAEDWYFQKSPIASERFRNEVENAFVRLQKHALLPRPKRDGSRRLSLHVFPYDLIYFIREDVIFVAAIDHHRRKPGHWRKHLQ
jgi:plasmid stabilization system protein ParE